MFNEETEWQNVMYRVIFLLKCMENSAAGYTPIDFIGYICGRGEWGTWELVLGVLAMRTASSVIQMM